jgi:hypothetical protein
VNSQRLLLSLHLPKIPLTTISWRTRHCAKAWQQWLAKPLWIQLTALDFEAGS